MDGLIVTTVGKGRFTTSLNGAQVLRNGIIVNWESANSHMTISLLGMWRACDAVVYEEGRKIHGKFLTSW